MKWTAFLLVCASLCQAQDFYTAQAARMVIGQSPFTAAEPGLSSTQLGSVGGVALASNTLIVADANTLGGTPTNHRVLIYLNVSSFVPDRKAPYPQNGTNCPACVGEANIVLGQPDFATNDLKPTSQNTFRNPTGVAYNGRVLAVADTDNNRVLIWRSLPTTNQQNADLVVGQTDFKGALPGSSAAQLRGPQGVFLDSNNGLWVADTANDRVMFYGEITQNGQSAKFVLGQPNFGPSQQTQRYPNYLSRADTLLGPTGMITDGTRLYVADAGTNRVLIWNSIPATNAKPADVVLGQPDMNSPDFTQLDIRASRKLCASNGTDSAGNPTYPDRCASTLDLPRSVATEGNRLYVADTGNDRVLIWNQIPTQNGQAADTVLGQQNMEGNQSSDSGNPGGVSATDTFKTPVSIAWDGSGQNIFVADTYNRRIQIYTKGDFSLPVTAVRNAASPKTFASGNVVFSGTIQADDELTIKIGNNTLLNPDGTVQDPTSYTIKVLKDDTFETIIDRFVQTINTAPDPWVIATPNKPVNAIIFTARKEDVQGNDVTLATATSPDTAKAVLTASGANLTGGQNPSLIAPFAIVAILGDNLSDQTVPAVDLTKPLPLQLGGVELFVAGIQCPIIAVAPDRIVAQVPVESSESTSASGVLRVQRNGGNVTVSAAVAIPIIAQNPAVYNDLTLPPAPGLAYHYSSQATGTISVDGTPHGGDVATVKIRDRSYSYTVNTSDTLGIVRDNLISLINASDPEVEAYSAGPFQRIRLRAIVPGPEGNGIPISASATADSQVIMTALNSQLCCANEAGAPISDDNPAMPGETIVVLATGLGLVGPEEARDSMTTGQPYYGPALNDATEFVSSLVGGKTANVLFAGLRRGAVGIYEVHLELNPDLPTNPKTEANIAQSYQVSNIFTIPVVNPTTPQ